MSPFAYIEELFKPYIRIESTMENREIKLLISTSHHALKRKWREASYLFSFLVANMKYAIQWNAINHLIKKKRVNGTNNVAS
jgi:hypothetical protein